MTKLDSNVQFSGFVEARNNETSIRWQKVQVFFFINSMLLGAVVGTSIADTLKLIACAFGFSVTIIWWLIQWEAQNAIDFWNNKIAEIEKNGNVVKGFAFAKPREGFEFKFISTHYLILGLIKLFGTGWIGLFIYYL